MARGKCKQRRGQVLLPGPSCLLRRHPPRSGRARVGSSPHPTRRSIRPSAPRVGATLTCPRLWPWSGIPVGVGAVRSERSVERLRAQVDGSRGCLEVIAVLKQMDPAVPSGTGVTDWYSGAHVKLRHTGGGRNPELCINWLILSGFQCRALE